MLKKMISEGLIVSVFAVASVLTAAPPPPADQSVSVEDIKKGPDALKNKQTWQISYNGCQYVFFKEAVGSDENRVDEVSRIQKRISEYLKDKDDKSIQMSISTRENDVSEFAGAVHDEDTDEGDTRKRFYLILGESPNKTRIPFKLVECRK